MEKCLARTQRSVALEEADFERVNGKANLNGMGSLTVKGGWGILSISPVNIWGMGYGFNYSGASPERLEITSLNKPRARELNTNILSFTLEITYLPESTFL